MKLYYAPGACSLAVHIVLRELDVDFSLVTVDLATHRTGEQDFFSLSDHGRVPLLVLEDGTRLTEGPAVCQYLADRFAREDLLPAAGSLERFRVHEWQNFIATELHKNFAPFFKPGYPDASRTLMRDTLSTALSWVAMRLERRDFLTGDTFTVADAYLFTITGWVDAAAITLPARLRAYRQTLMQRDSIAQALKAEGLL
ncbi:Glutathione S-transferase domain protein [Alloalcanivorax dieselolei B5]|uniref:Glutathione S-transferase domain protein n=1 Tax=Alcanivorax dieselolei (strain DSM 16502 / CGMCC 1.3690 / MCCC 1A00001 / B-5) TaxID=930169 RepID=K0CC26_ALCDB|nr:glutathione transferase GstA [Alloalcanivorax dieselolei]AFT70133.1 Glutathione S-transferase domain protein [Alloalcanivorax dieselolei B5]GGJ96197.1 glutathione S-transferase [Alloalcanivorax dieselolei]